VLTKGGICGIIVCENNTVREEMKMIYVTSDLHGYSLEDFVEFLDSTGFCEDDVCYVLGDVIDRGSEGVDLLKWIMKQPNVVLLLGNHEEMMLECEFVFAEITNESVDSLSKSSLEKLYLWQFNGGGETLKALRKQTPRVRAEILEYLKNAPLYKEVECGGRKFVLSHSGLGNFDKDKPLSEYTRHELLWTRPDYFDTFYDDKILVFGHTPSRLYGKEYAGRAVNRGSWIDIDAGVSGGYDPMILRLDDLREFYMNS
jgi:serine/threonine protein phosphatase 1